MDISFNEDKLLKIKLELLKLFEYVILLIFIAKFLKILTYAKKIWTYNLVKDYFENFELQNFVFQ